MLSNTHLDFILDMEVTDHKHHDRWHRKQNRESSTSGMLFKKKILLEVSYFGGKIYEMETVTLGLCYIEDLTFLENSIVLKWFWNSLDVQSTDSSVEICNIFHIWGFF